MEPVFLIKYLLTSKKKKKRILSQAMCSLKFDRMIKKVIDKQKIKELSPPKTALQEILKRLL